MLEGMLTGIRQPASLLVPPVLLEERRSTEIFDYGDDLVARIIAHIRDHVCDGIRVGDLVKIFPVSRRTLSRRFIKYVGHSPASEIRHARLVCARRMLLKTNRSLTEIALTCGYADLSHMDHTFRDILDKIPSEMRRKSLF
ncbi:MAG TPA: AraC family transcriptional regulator [Phycisphaerae bacterium]|nr:AraC family transcriptional regulator [Phycisphaerae bacterium]